MVCTIKERHTPALGKNLRVQAGASQTNARAAISDALCCGNHWIWRFLSPDLRLPAAKGPLPLNNPSATFKFFKFFVRLGPIRHNLATRLVVSLNSWRENISSVPSLLFPFPPCLCCITSNCFPLFRGEFFHSGSSTLFPPSTAQSNCRRIFSPRHSQVV